MKGYKLDISIFVGGLPFDGSTIPENRSLGGSETAGIQAAEALARQGHHVTVFSDCEKISKTAGVTYRPIGWVQNGNNRFPKGYFDYIRSTPTDVCIVQRLPVFFQFETQAKVNFLWQHDLATRTGPSVFQPFLWNIDKIFILSEFMQDQYQKVHGGTDEVYHITRNGIDISLVDQVEDQPRDRFKIMYTARPERGLDILLGAVFPRILSAEPRAKLCISRYQDPATLPLYQHLDAVAAKFGDRVEFLGNLGKTDLYRHYKQARMYLYPSMFEEIFCISALEVAACGLVFLGPHRAALPETIGSYAPLILDDGSLGQSSDEPQAGFKAPTDKFIDGIVDYALRLMRDDDLWKYWQRRGIARARSLSWDGVATDWSALAHELIEAKSSNPHRLVKHFLFHSDVVAARRYVESIDKPDLTDSVERYIDRYMPHMSKNSPKPTVNEFYEARSGGANANWRTGFFAEQEPRFHQLMTFLRPKVEAGEIKTILDFGCAHGGYARAISNAFPNVQVFGVDNSPSLIRCCNEMKVGKLDDGQPAALYPDNLTFAVGDEDSKLWEQPGLEDKIYYFDTAQTSDDSQPSPAARPAQFDCLICMEVLEHLPDSEDVAWKLEKMAKPGKYVAFTVPFGHRERDEFVSKNVPPVHVRSFDMHDLRDMFSKKQEFAVDSFSDLQELPMDRTFAGWFMVTYKADHERIGDVDYERKFTLQGPRETLAVCMIANNSESTIHRALRSVVKFADQLIVVDNGPSADRTAEVAAEYTPDVRAGTSPFWCYNHLAVHDPSAINPDTCEIAGFETPRNESVDGVWADWILWLDCDEQVLDANNMPKYFRSNQYLGYAVQQHHITIDHGAAIKKDIPVRIYRNIPGMRFYGVVHEHAELGINRGIGPMAIVLSDIHIHHDGYLVESVRRGRFHRNIKLLECDRKKYPQRTLGIFLYELRDCMQMARYTLENNGGAVDPFVRRLCATAINAFRQHFAAESFILADESLGYYSQALELLGEGIEVHCEFDVKKNHASLAGPHQTLHFRAVDSDEASRLIQKKLAAAAGACTGPYIS